MVDAAGNDGAIASQDYTLDTARPAAPSAPDLGHGHRRIEYRQYHRERHAVFTGAAEAGTMVTLYDTDGSTVLETTVATGGALSAISGSGLTRTATFTPTVGVNSDTASITVASGSYVDVAGNGGGAGPTPSLTFDTLAPGAPSMPGLAIGSDSGVLGDGVTNIDTPTFTGRREAGANVKLFDTREPTLLGSAVADGLGNWSIVSSRLSVGARTIVAKATDLAGNGSSASPEVVVTIETTQTPQPESEPGVVTIVTPVGNQVAGDVHDNFIAPSGGADTVPAGGGDDTVQGGAHDDMLQGNASIAAGGGSDLVYGGQGDDFLNGNTGDDRLYGGKGDGWIVADRRNRAASHEGPAPAPAR